MRKKITVIGAGNVGASLVQVLSLRGYADLVVVDVVEGLPQGKALDLMQSGPLAGFSSNIEGTNDYSRTAGSSIAVITSGIARKPGMSRDDLLLTNMKIVQDVVNKIIGYSPGCIIVVVTNPLDAMAQLALKVSGLPRSKVIGMSGVLDSTRFRAFVAMELGVAVEDVSALVLGGHGDTMVPLSRLAAVGGIPLTELLSQDKIDSIVKRTVNAGAEIVALLKTGSAYYAPAAAVAEMVDSIVLDQKRILPCAVYLEGEYGISGVVVGVPVLVGSDGVEKIFEIKLTVQEKEALQRSARAVRELADIMKLP